MTIFFIQKSFENIEIWAKQLQQYGPQNMKCALIGNKVDLEDFRAVSKEVIRYSVLQVTVENLITGQLM